MIHAFNELYLNDAQTFLATLFDYAINDCKLDPTFVSSIFASSQMCYEFEHGNPRIISGKSGTEGAIELINKINPTFKFKKPSFKSDRTPEYWAGWALAYYQWYTTKRFKDIFTRIPLNNILKMYKVFHEMDLSNFIEAMDLRYNSVVLDTKLKKIRELRSLSQQELSNLSGVKLRSIQLYEQRVNDIDKAQGQTLYKLARALWCNIEDLLEHPEDEFIKNPGNNP